MEKNIYDKSGKIIGEIREPTQVAGIMGGVVGLTLGLALMVVVAYVPLMIWKEIGSELMGGNYKMFLLISISLLPIIVRTIMLVKKPLNPSFGVWGSILVWGMAPWLVIACLVTLSGQILMLFAGPIVGFVVAAVPSGIGAVIVGIYRKQK